MFPATLADMGRPEGATVQCKVSRRSRYISLDVCFTFARRQGIVEIVEGVDRKGSREPDGNVTFARSFFMMLGGSTTSRRPFGSVLKGRPSSHISPRSSATMS